MMEEKPQVTLAGQNGNIFNLLSIATKALKENNQRKQAKELQEKLFSANSYHEAIQLIGEYCEVIE